MCADLRLPAPSPPFGPPRLSGVLPGILSYHTQFSTPSTLHSLASLFLPHFLTDYSLVPTRDSISPPPPSFLPLFFTYYSLFPTYLLSRRSPERDRYAAPASDYYSRPRDPYDPRGMWMFLFVPLGVCGWRAVISLSVLVTACYDLSICSCDACYHFSICPCDDVGHATSDCSCGRPMQLAIL